MRSTRWSLKQRPIAVGFGTFSAGAFALATPVAVENASDTTTGSPGKSLEQMAQDTNQWAMPSGNYAAWE